MNLDKDVLYTQWSISHKKNEVTPFCSNMDGPRDYHTKWHKSDEKDKFHIISLICGIWKKRCKWIFDKVKTDIKNKLTVTKGEKGWGRDKLGVWD